MEGGGSPVPPRAKRHRNQAPLRSVGAFSSFFGGGGNPNKYQEEKKKRSKSKPTPDLQISLEKLRKVKEMIVY